MPAAAQPLWALPAPARARRLPCPPPSPPATNLKTHAGRYNPTYDYWSYKFNFVWSFWYQLPVMIVRPTPFFDLHAPGGCMHQAFVSIQLPAPLPLARTHPPD
jgi:hypothetical protein